MSGSIELSGEEYSELVAKLAAVERELLVSQRFAESQQVLKEQNIQRWIQAQEKLASVETTLAEITGTRTAIGDNLQTLQHRAQNVRRLVEAARAYLEKQTAARQLELAAALKPFEEM